LTINDDFDMVRTWEAARDGPFFATFSLSHPTFHAPSALWVFHRDMMNGNYILDSTSQQ